MTLYKPNFKRLHDNLLDKALTQKTDVKLKKQKRSKDQLTKDEIEYILFAINLLNPGCLTKEHNGAKQKLNNQLKEMI